MDQESVEREWNIGMLLRAPQQLVIARLHAAIAAAGFDDVLPAHGNVLQHLQNEGIRLTEIARRAALTKQTIGQYVAYLEQRGYVAVVPDPTDGRARLVMKTEKGRAVEQVAEQAMRQLEADWVAVLGEKNYARLRRLLTSLVTADDRGRAPSAPTAQRTVR
jgi:DNA-binding MarR family transcriptional regulator